MTSFTFQTAGSRVVFGAGSLDVLPAELDRLGVSKVLLVSTRGRSLSLGARVHELLGQRVAGSFDDALVHVPESVAIQACESAVRVAADCVVALGGGSAIGVAKAIALQMAVAVVAVPTTYSGSEMTPVWGLTRGGVKETGRDPRVQPSLVIYDPDLTVGLSARATATSGLNAVAHCMEALYAPDANPLTTSAAKEGMRLLRDALLLLAASPTDREQRSHALCGAWLAGFSLGTVQMGLHHKLCHTLGGSFDLPHADTHSVLLPYTAAFNRDFAIEAMSLAGEVLEVEDAPLELLSLSREIGAPQTLSDIGMRESDLGRAADLAVEREYPNPRPVTRDAVLELLRAAYQGDADYVAP